jgi:hypothetical protein
MSDEMNEYLNLCAGKIRSKSEILSTLDKQSQCHGLLFMPEMCAICGMHLRVYKRSQDLRIRFLAGLSLLPEKDRENTGWRINNLHLANSC